MKNNPISRAIVGTEALPMQLVVGIRGIARDLH